MGRRGIFSWGLYNRKVGSPGRGRHKDAMKAYIHDNSSRSAGRTKGVHKSVHKSVHKFDINSATGPISASKITHTTPLDQENGVQVADGSNPSTPTIFAQLERQVA
jgi:hypothetical protein